MIDSQQNQERRSRALCINTISSNANKSVNIKLAEKIGYTNVVFLSELIGKYESLCKIGGTYDGWFWYRQADIKKSSGLSFNRQSRASEHLLRENIIQKERKGKLARNFFKINFDVLIDIFCLDDHDVLQDNLQRGVFDEDHDDVLQDNLQRNVKIDTINTDIRTEDNKILLLPLVSNISSVRENANVMNDQKRDLQNGKEETPLPTLIKHRKEKPSIVAILAKTNPKQQSSIRKLNRPKLIPVPKDPSPSLAALASNGLKVIAEKQKADYKEKNKVTKMQNVPRPVQEIMDLWGELGLKLPSEKAIGEYNSNVKALKRIMKGTLIPKEKREFTPEDIRIAMCRFARLTFDAEYGPDQSQKDNYSKMKLNAFLYCPFSKKYKSHFLECFKEMPKKHEPSIKIAEDLHPNIKNKLVGFYYDYALAGLKKRLSEAEENKFREAANKICVLYDQNKERFAGVNGYHEMADMLCQSIYQSYGKRTTMVHPGSFCSSNAMAGMIKFMNEKGCIPDADSLIEFR